MTTCAWSRRLQLSTLAIGLLWMGCMFAPYAPRDPNALSPEGESEPVPEADPNPLDAPRSVTVVCTPQGEPTVESPDVLECDADEDCRVRCDRYTRPDPDAESP